MLFFINQAPAALSHVFRNQILGNVRAHVNIIPVLSRAATTGSSIHLAHPQFLVAAAKIASKLGYCVLKKMPTVHQMGLDGGWIFSKGFKVQLRGSCAFFVKTLVMKFEG